MRNCDRSISTRRSTRLRAAASSRNAERICANGRPRSTSHRGYACHRGCKISGGKVLSSHNRKSSSRLASQLRLVAVNVGRTETALGAFYRRPAARIGKAKAVTATARKIAILFYRTMRFGMQYEDPGVDQYEQRYRERVVK